MILQSINMAWYSIISRKMRSFLTMLGIIIGVASLVVMVSLVDGAASTITNEISSLGNNLISVTVFDDKFKPLSLSDLDKLQTDSAVSGIAPIVSTSSIAKNGGVTAEVTVNGTTAALFDIQGLSLIEGRFLKTADNKNRTYVTVVNSSAALDLFGRQNVVGETLDIGGNSFHIVGVLREDNSILSALVSSRIVYVPFTIQSRLVGQPYVSSFYVKSAMQENLGIAEDVLKNYLMQRFNNDEKAFSITNMTSVMDTMNTVTSTLGLLLGSIAAISLLVGGIGIMNIMLVSVTERTREIGIRKAIGASRSSIMLQFLIEATMLSLWGCALGLIASAFLLKIASVMAGGLINFIMSPEVIALAVIFSSSVGLLFGMYPANKASKMRPVEALRHDV